MRKTMNKTNKESYFEDPLAVDSTGLQELVGAGRRTATVIGMAAGAKIKVGKRVLWNVNKVKKYTFYRQCVCSYNLYQRFYISKTV